MPRFLPLLLSFLLLFTAGCASTGGVPLRYVVSGNLASCDGDVVVLKFADKRASTVLGRDDSGAAIMAASDVAEWVSWAVFEELSAAGCNAKYRAVTAVPGKGALVTGEVLDVRLWPSGTASYAARVTARIVVQKGAEVHAEKYVSEVESAVVPGISPRENVLAEALKGIAEQAVPMVASRCCGGR